MRNLRFTSKEFECTLCSPLSFNDGHKHTSCAWRMNLLRFMCTAWVLVATLEATATQHVVPIDAAKKIAADFLGDVEIVKNQHLKKTRASLGEETADQPLYIFNSSAGKGFVIVSGDDRTEKILGYSDTGRFDADNIPTSLNWLLEQYQAHIESLDGTAPIQSASEGTDWPAIEPLLTAYWHQGAPFNGLLPMNTIYNDHTSVGCVPTAIAQIIHYHKWPDRGEGTFSYTDWMGKTYDFDYENTSFNWDLINGEYDEQSSKESCDEVAKLVYACAVGMETTFDYDSGIGSGSDVAMVKRFLLENFKYSADAEILGIGNFSIDEWNDIIYKELQASRPVYMQGGVSPGHAFVCDGYGGDKYFHINWGWGGGSNGYFLLSPLKPADNNFALDLVAMINIHKREGGEEPYTYDIICNGEVVLDTIYQDLYMNLGTWGNYSRHDIVGGSMYLEYVNTETLESKYEYIHNGINIEGTVPFINPYVIRTAVGQGNIYLSKTNFQLAPGKYKIYPAYSVAESPIKRVRCLAGARQYISLTVTDNHECIYANSEDVVTPNVKIAIHSVSGGGDETSGVKTTDEYFIMGYTVKNYSDNYPYGKFTVSIINEDGVEVTKMRDCGITAAPNSEYSEIVVTSLYLQPGKHQIKCLDAYGNDITEKPYYFQVEGEPHTLEITDVKQSYDGWGYEGSGEDDLVVKYFYTFDVEIKTSHPANSVPDLDMKLLKDGNEIFSRFLNKEDCMGGFRIFASLTDSLDGEYQLDIHDAYGNQLENSPFNLTIKDSSDTSDNIGQLKVDNARHPAGIYDLTGRKVIDPKNLKRGIYIVNDKKVIVK